jgi:glycine/D-amino acid oxidase-like deaminating enzyme/nitrite reductase/ring-hydroxylating ferredoxin subunit
MALPDHSSYWMDTAPGDRFPRLSGEVRVDVCVVGGGIAGLSAAWELKRRGKTVAVVEAGRLAASVTGYTTAKITSLHTRIYTDLVRHFGEDKARLYGEAQQEGLHRIVHWAGELAVDCDLERLPAFTYATEESGAEELRAEAETAAALGLPASFVTETDLPFPVTGAVRFDGQAQFHPRRYLLALAARISGDGSHVFEQTRMHGVSDGTPATVACEGGTVVAEDVVIATHYPVLDRGLMFVRLEPHRDVVVAGHLPDDQGLEGMYISTEASTHSIRVAPTTDGPLLIVGGEPWKTGKEQDVQARYDALGTWASSTFGITPRWQWSTQDNSTADGVPYVGLLHPATKHLYVACGFGGWGMTNGAVGGVVLADLIMGEGSPYADLLDPRRVKPITSAKTIAVNAVEAVRGLVVETLTPSEVDSVDDIAPGEGALVRVRGEKTAVHRDDEGRLHGVSARCTHLGCFVHFNNAERSWDCPCHGSRFDCTGAVLQGPANRPLEKKAVD